MHRNRGMEKTNFQTRAETKRQSKPIDCSSNFLNLCSFFAAIVRLARRALVLKEHSPGKARRTCCFRSMQNCSFVTLMKVEEMRIENDTNDRVHPRIFSAGLSASFRQRLQAKAESKRQVPANNKPFRLNKSMSTPLPHPFDRPQGHPCRKTNIWKTTLLLLLLTTLATAQEPFQPPKNYPESRYTKVWKNSPFELEAAPETVIAETKQQPNDLTLAGVMKKGEDYIVYVQHKKTKEVTKATTEPGTSGILLKNVIPGSTPGDYQVEIEHQGRLVTLSYDRATLASVSPRTLYRSGNNRPSNPRKPTSADKADFNPAKLALEKARQAAAARAVQTPNNGKDQPNGKAKASGSRRRTIFVPK